MIISDAHRINAASHEDHIIRTISEFGKEQRRERERETAEFWRVERTRAVRLKVAER